MELSNEITILKDLVIKLLTRIDELEAENAELRSRLNKNSSNSHKPPSTDGLTKKPAFSQSNGKKTGGQFGHPGKALSMVANADHILVHHAQPCPCCSKTFTFAQVSHISQKRQIFDIPQPRLEVTEHQLGLIICCGTHHKGGFPDFVGQAV